MRQVIFSVALLAPGMAFGADAPVFSPDPATTWNGLYAGAAIGLAWSSANGFGEYSNLSSYEQRSSSGGFSGAAKAGFNIQQGQIVVGLEVDIQTVETETSTDYVDRSNTPSASAKLSASVNWMSTLRGRFGMLVTPSIMLYATVGLALADVQMSEAWAVYNPALISAGIFPNSKTHSRVNLGWVIGGGLEYAMASQWSVVAEAFYTDFGTVSYRDFDIPGRVSSAQSGEVSLGIARAGINYRF
ncbi:porin family protein [Aquabacter sp. L1I39]|uniref:outer membrane protein n=1 Tax=Aquabacter sp. L1I39 TaxID=2820278 RepID=UPI001ADCD088|nr:outer membrane beta-barrel protein [Aquabacter sp. L1I39]QTL01908.1 porin family protein [Aquabacter sp. L1I39]